MKKEQYLKHVRKQITYIFDRDSIERELSMHLQDSIEELLEEGFADEEAERLAVEQMGDPVEVGRMLNREHHPLLGYGLIASVVVLILLAIPSLTTLAYGAYHTFQTLTPMVVENSVEQFSVDLNLNMPTHKVKIDNICKNEDGTYYLTYRSWIRFDYSRAGWSSDLFCLQDSEGNHLTGGGFQSHSFLGSYGYIRFDLPADGLLYLHTRQGELIEIDWEEG